HSRHTHRTNASRRWSKCQRAGAHAGEPPGIQVRQFAGPSLIHGLFELARESLVAVGHDITVAIRPACLPHLVFKPVGINEALAHPTREREDGTIESILPPALASAPDCLDALGHLGLEI